MPSMVLFKDSEFFLVKYFFRMYVLMIVLFLN